MIPGGGSRQILIVDDDPDFATATSRALALEGIGCRIAHDGAAAMDALADEDIEIALLDIRIGQEDGTELAVRMRDASPGLILVLMTAYASVDSAVAALKAGAYDYLRKPFFLDELMRSLERCFQLADLRRGKARAERELAQIRQLETTARLAAGLSHDFRNMLAVIKANLSVLDERLHKSDALKPYAHDALEAALTAETLVARLLGFARARPTTGPPVDLRPLVAGPAEMLRRSLCAGMTLTVSLPDQPLSAPVNPGQMETAVVNLLINARDATGGKGAATISLQHVWRGSDYARLTVQDDGLGFAPDALEHALEPMFTTKPDGTGLGLPMIQQMALLGGGDFRLVNAVGGGACAILEMPCLAPGQGSGENM